MTLMVEVEEVGVVVTKGVVGEVSRIEVAEVEVEEETRIGAEVEETKVYCNA